ncbi:hypothetical protein HBH98_225140 [Parastagonospora nodorum]|nr:hypothetical protein HBH52_058050 [Parastagonospora nodorum]KAH3985485.1 hypothetical protein HBH51_016950 [Parastagonospora nodorum]KAH4038132.1 hypothetical protein HBI09_063460 [Parastagonospora nodorum]KAH4054438.1 hypothetical protein HBH49_080270 [Parastagonospora nodorum]KAH4057696.1 hypothetical protein HBH50_236940 [Parastagonospora nodorum]
MEEKIRREPFPFDENVVFHESSFFEKSNALLYLPAPTEVRELITRHAPVTFPSLGLLVKYGTEVTLEEGQCLLLIRNTLCVSEVVPIPEVYGWCKDDDQVYIHMELLDSITLEKSGETMTEGEKTSVGQQLHDVVNVLRAINQDSWPPFISHVGKQPLLDIIFTDNHSPTAYGPSRDVQDASPPYRSFLPDNVPVIAIIVDWHQSGWYPDYWKYWKARWTSQIGQEWESKYLPPEISGSLEEKNNLEGCSELQYCDFIPTL